MIFSDGRVNVVSWATDRAGGFSDPDLRLFEKVLPTYSTIVEVKSLRRFATNVLSTYVGREPGELIMKGQIRRGDVRTIKAALMMVDLRDFTILSDALPHVGGYRDTQSLLRLRYSAYQKAWWGGS
jgi:adenylate cyclase